MSYKILVVEDDEYNMKILKKILKDENYKVYTQSDGKDAVEKAKWARVDAVLLDIMMPEIDGFSVCQLLKEDPETRDIPIIMVTAITEGETLKRAFELGAFDYIKKPIDRIEVLARLSAALEYSEQQKKLQDMAMRDGLTGLYTHTLLLELLEKECSKARRYKTSLAFLMIDIDHFKKVNDTYGHRAGDMILSLVADTLEINSRRSDVVGRYGGEEFGIVLQDISYDNAWIVCERIRSSVENFEYRIGDKTVKITISIGMAYKESEAEADFEKMITTADKALYQAKKNGRNRTESIVLSRLT
ncbi:MAG: diguanylate cyclase [Halanaerobiaceae bacterium]|nr:diguanylate cyclase [Halanaerobiaceae bacterium]